MTMQGLTHRILCHWLLAAALVAGPHLLRAGQGPSGGVLKHLVAQPTPEFNNNHFSNKNRVDLSDKFSSKN